MRKAQPQMKYDVQSKIFVCHIRSLLACHLISLHNATLLLTRPLVVEANSVGLGHKAIDKNGSPFALE